MENTLIPENDPTLQSFIEIATDSHFPIQNLPFGIFRPKNNDKPRVGIAIGDFVLDLAVLAENGLFDSIAAVRDQSVFHANHLNAFIALGRKTWRETRAVISQLLRSDTPTLRDNVMLRKNALWQNNDVEMLLPLQIGDFTDFYSSKEHATNAGLMFRGKENPLLPNWVHLPVAYTSRVSSIVVSGTDFRRPMGQIKLADEMPIHAPSEQLDTEVEVAFIVGAPNKMGEPIPVNEAREHVFGMTLLSDWSARDIQRWEYVPLGPFLGKNFCTSISPWIVTLDALEPFRKKGCEQSPIPLPYLLSTRDWAYDIHLEFLLQTEKMQQPERIALTNYKDIYWDFCQQLAHHTMGGCPMNIGDIFASGTISGATSDSYGSILEIAWGGTRPIKLQNGEERKFLMDGDRVIMRGWCQGQGYSVGFGELTGKVLPSLKTC